MQTTKVKHAVSRTHLVGCPEPHWSRHSRGPVWNAASVKVELHSRLYTDFIVFGLYDRECVRGFRTQTIILALQFLMEVVLLSREGEGCWTPLVSWTVLIMAPWGPWQKSQVGITVCSFVAGGASEAGSGRQPQSMLPSPQQASCLFALEVVLSQVTVKVAGSQDDILQFNYQLGIGCNSAAQGDTRTHTLCTSLWTPSVHYTYIYISMTEKLWI